MKLSEIETITGRVEDGAWVKNIPNLPGLSLKVRGINCTAADVLRSQLLQDLPEEARRKPSDADNERIATQVMARVLLVDWNITEDGPAGADGKPTQVRVPFTVEAAQTALANPKVRLLRDGVAYASQFVALLGTDRLEADAKN